MADDGSPLNQLPEVYRVALQLRNAQCTDAEIAEKLEMEREGVAALLLLAEAKLAVIRRNC